MRKTCIFTLLLVVAFGLATAGVAEANLLSNPGFEVPIGDNTDPDVWWGLRQYPNETDVVMKNSTAQAYSGSQSGRITMTASTPGGDQNLWAGYGQQIDVTAGQPVFASAWVKSTDAYGTQAKLQLEFKDIMGNEINRTYDTSPVNQTFDWTLLEIDGVVAPAGTQSVLVNLLIEKGAGAAHGEYFWDDTSLDVVPEPSSLFLLGSGLMGLLGISRKRKQA